ncbi:hypothetical protein CFOL_v3_15241 [Cephalotus follicularis]|uniref:Uncharacterized protein n=1 Tax=Cephalotus follicularis TaxID=3775 RepID=A0A1Q3BUW8_CEPFO|nr:hypothetical protein CFOL_v3_15241 [Cephalotus follicularis]
MSGRETTLFISAIGPASLSTLTRSRSFARNTVSCLRLWRYLSLKVRLFCLLSANLLLVKVARRSSEILQGSTMDFELQDVEIHEVDDNATNVSFNHSRYVDLDMDDFGMGDKEDNDEEYVDDDIDDDVNKHNIVGDDLDEYTGYREISDG